MKKLIKLKPLFKSLTLRLRQRDVRLVLTRAGSVQMDHSGVLTGSGPLQQFASKSFGLQQFKEGLLEKCKKHNSRAEAQTPEGVFKKVSSSVHTALIYTYNWISEAQNLLRDDDLCFISTALTYTCMFL